MTVEVGLPQLPFWQVSPEVQALSSLQAVPLGWFGFEHMPVAGLQVPAVWHWSEAVQVTVEVGLPQLPFWQVSPEVQALLSLQTVLLGRATLQLHLSPIPVVLQTPLVHWFDVGLQSASTLHAAFCTQAARAVPRDAARMSSAPAIKRFSPRFDLHVPRRWTSMTVFALLPARWPPGMVPKLASGLIVPSVVTSYWAALECL